MWKAEAGGLDQSSSELHTIYIKDLNVQASELLQQGKTPAAKPEDPSLIPGTHTYGLIPHTTKT